MVLFLSKLVHNTLDCWSKPTDWDVKSKFAEALNQEKEISPVLLVQAKVCDQLFVRYSDSGEGNHICEKKKIFEELVKDFH